MSDTRIDARCSVCGQEIEITITHTEYDFGDVYYDAIVEPHICYMKKKEEVKNE